MDIMKRLTKGRVIIELIDLGSHEWCVRKTTKGLFFGEKIEFFMLDRNGLSLTHNSLVSTITVGSKERCELIFAANCVQMGDKDN